MDSTKNTLAIIAVLVVVTGGLIYVDYSSNHAGSAPSFFSNVLQTLFRPTTITSDVLTAAAFDPKTLVTLPQTSDFFAPYLKLPQDVVASVFTLPTADGNITIYEVNNAKNAFDIVSFLGKQPSPTGAYTLNIKDAGTFYLNQTPLSTKTGNFLAIVINNILYGFQYPVAQHPNILKLTSVIDSLQNNK